MLLRSPGLKAWARTIGAVALLATLYFLSPDSGFHIAGMVLGLAVLTWLVTRQVQRALRPGRIMAEQISMLLTLVNLVTIFFANVYFNLSGQFDGLETKLDALYFSTTTLCTVGFGDITAVGQAARAIVVVQMVFDLIIVTSAISIVVGATRRN